MLVTYPLDLMRTRLSAFVDKRPSSILKLDATIVAPDGPRGLCAILSTQQRSPLDCTVAELLRSQLALPPPPPCVDRGLLISLLEIMPYTAISFGGYNWLKSRTATVPAADGAPQPLYAWLVRGCALATVPAPVLI
eukprot:SAG11_NODE_4512_length_1868_cov_2.170153_1_plen_135_part_01